MSRASVRATRIDCAAQVSGQCPPGPHKARDNPPIFVSCPCRNRIRSPLLTQGTKITTDNHEVPPPKILVPPGPLRRTGAHLF